MFFSKKVVVERYFLFTNHVKVLFCLLFSDSVVCVLKMKAASSSRSSPSIFFMAPSRGNTRWKFGKWSGS